MGGKRLAVGMLCVCFGTGAVWAVDTTGWCSGVTGSPVIVCDDFDDYCPDPPCDDAIGDDTPDQNAFLAVWPGDGCHTEPDEFGVSSPINAEVVGNSVCGEGSIEPCAESVPFAILQNMGVYYPDAKNDQYLFDGTSHRHDMVPRIQQLDPVMGSVNATDTVPLVLEFVLDLPGDSTHRFDASQTNRYIELTDGSDRAPAEVEIVACDDTKLRPVVDLSDTFDHHAIAIGVFAVLDQDPCSPEEIPLTYRLSLYDGARWITLKPNVLGSGNPSGDGLKVGGHLNHVTLTIWGSSIDVEIHSTIDGLPWNETASAPRMYPGGFAAMHVGNGACLPSRRDDYVDNIVLSGGVLEPAIATGACCLGDGSCMEATTAAGCVSRLGGVYAGDGVDCAAANCPQPSGACCLPNGTCAETTQDVCEGDLSGFYHGDFTSCLDVNCCPDPFADADGDTDVDQEDFGAFQICMTGLGGGLLAGCECFDRPELNSPDGDGDIDENDWSVFEACASGPDIPADPTCDD